METSEYEKYGYLGDNPKLQLFIKPDEKERNDVSEKYIKVDKS